MDHAKDIRDGEDLNWQKLEAHLRQELTETTGAMSIAQFHGGHANLTYLVKFDNKEYVLRRPPFGTIAPGAHDMKREYKVLSKLNPHFPPAPHAYHYCADTDIIGAPFVILDRRQGVVMRQGLPACFSSYDKAEKRLTAAMVRALAELHMVDYEKVGLSQLGRPEGFLERQIAGWTKRWTLSQSEKSEHMDNVLQKLQEDLPTTQKISIIHNDVKLDNCQFQPDNPDKVTALFDWDMCTLGDPLMDLGIALSYHPDERKKDLKNLPIQLIGDFPPGQFIKDIYQEHTGLSLENISWYEAFAYAKAAVISQQLYKRYLDGDTNDERMKSFGLIAKAMSKIAADLIL